MNGTLAGTLFGILLMWGISVALAEMPLPVGEVTLEIEDFVLHATDADGNLSHRLRGTRLREFGRDGPQLVDDPDLDIHAEGEVEWNWVAPQALHFPESDILNLIGPTRGVQPARGERVQTVIHSADVQVTTDTMVATSEVWSTLNQPGLFQRGVGLRVDSQGDTIEWFQDVYTLYSESGDSGDD